MSEIAEFESQHGKETDLAEDLENEALLIETGDLLNELTQQTLSKVSNKFRKLEPRMNTVERLTGVVEMIFQKAREDPTTCAMLCDRMIMSQWRRVQGAKAKEEAAMGDDSSVITPNKDAQFRKILFAKCQSVCEKDTEFEQLKMDKMEAVEKEERSELKDQLQADLDELVSMERRQSSENMRFVGELYYQSVLSRQAMLACLSSFIRNADKDPEALESICTLLAPIDDNFENLQSNGDVDEFCLQLEEWAKDPQQPVRYQRMIVELLALKQNNWEPKTKGDGKKKKRLQQDAQLEKLINNANWTDLSWAMCMGRRR